MDEVAILLKANLLLQMELLKEPEERMKLEVVLAKAGIAHKDIADWLGKTPAAVAKSVSRAGRK